MDESVFVSILIPNYNYGRYLRECLDSVLAQTYHNIEVIFRDNNSTDDSFEIAMEYYPKFKERGIYFSIHRNLYNCGSDKNTNLCITDCHGDIIYVLASDDNIEPTFIEKCVSVFQRHPNVSMVMTHRAEIDEHGNRRETVPFYNKSCIVESEKQAAVFMMTGIAIPGQRMGRQDCINRVKELKRSWSVAGDWYNNFLYSCVGDVAYINEPLCNYRVHSGNETSASEDKLIGSFEHYQLLDAFVNVSRQFGMTLPAQRYDEAVRKLGSMCLRYALKMLLNGKRDIAEKYLYLALIYDKDIRDNEDYVKMQALVQGQCQDKEKLLKEMQEGISERKISYDPPEGSLEIDSYGNLV